MQSLIDIFQTGTKLRTFATKIAAVLLKVCLAVAALLLVIAIGCALVFMGWGATIPAQIQVTIDRQGMPYDQFLSIFTEAASKHGFAVQRQGESWETGKFTDLTNKTKSAEIHIGHPTPTIDLGLTMFSVVDRNNGNSSIQIAKKIGEELTRQFPIKRVYVQLDPRQYDCKGKTCSFVMPLPIDDAKMPRWLGK